MTQLEEIRNKIDDLAGRVYSMARVTETMKYDLADLYYKKDIVEEFWSDIARGISSGAMTIDEAYDTALKEPLIDFHDFAKEVTERGIDVSDVEWL